MKLNQQPDSLKISTSGQVVTQTPDPLHKQTRNLAAQGDAVNRKRAAPSRERLPENHLIIMKSENLQTRAGMGILVMREGRVLLGKRRGSHGAGYYAAPGGHIEYGESFAETARREVREETGLEITSLRLLSVGNYLFDGARHYVDIDVVCEAPFGEAQLREPEKCEGWAWYDPDDLPEPLFIVTRRMLEARRSGVILRDIEAVERQ